MMVSVDEVQTRLDRFLETKGGCQVTLTHPKIMEICGYELGIADESLRLWVPRHVNDCDIVSENPLTVKIYPTIVPDKENRIAFENRERKRQYARQKADERRQWDSMTFSPDKGKGSFKRSKIPHLRSSRRN